MNAHPAGGVGRCSPSCAKYTIVNIRWKRTQRDFSGNLLKAASIKGSINSTPSVFHRYGQHSMNLIPAASPPALNNGSSSFIDSRRPRLSASSTTFVTSMIRSCPQPPLLQQDLHIFKVEGHCI